ncbi:MAG: zinc ABC transporter substrate-binding protein [Oscillospiraceae bacterium]|nr:zinc ABC transporter substrate-binding protein [Oscillospiraceae bacterium]
MKKILISILLLLLLSGCAAQEPAQVAATTLPVYEFTSLLCEGTGITVTRLVTEEVSCLHDYSLNVRQVKSAEAAELIVLSGAGLEEFLDDMLLGKEAIDASQGIELLCPEEEHDHDHEEEHDHEHEGHHHDQDPHIWLSPENAKIMARNIHAGLCAKYPEYADTFAANLDTLLARLDELKIYGEETLNGLSCRELITFHDGFAYFAEAFDLTILEAVEEESGSEASAKELIHLIEEVEHHSLPAIFTETNGSTSAADIISRETGATCHSLDMAMSGDSYFTAMYHNIDTIKEALQ